MSHDLELVARVNGPVEHHLDPMCSRIVLSGRVLSQRDQLVHAGNTSARIVNKPEEVLGKRIPLPGAGNDILQRRPF